MKKSQLRKLAAEFADGRIPAEEYRTRRRELIDAIVAGDSAIEREPPARSAAPPPPFAHSPSARRDVPWYLVLAGSSLLCVALLVWLLWPSPEPRTAEPPPVVLAPEVPRSRTLVESFLALRDFSAGAIAQFESQWMALDEVERNAARSQLWFRSLVSALRDEVKTQKALAGLSDDDAPMRRARRVVELAQRLDVAEQLPPLRESDLAAPPASTLIAPAHTASPTVSPTTAGAPAASNAADSPPDTSVAPTRDGARAALPPADPVATQPTGRQWLAARDADELTLQIFAVNALDRVEQLMSRHPDLDLHILATEGSTPRYRVFHGVFGDTDAARDAFAALPADVADAAGEAIVKSIAVVREDLQGRAPSRTAANAPAAAGDYTLQLFASTSRSNAQSLIDAFPSLSLELRELSGDTAPYRVVYGRFDNAREAAVAVLPAALLSRIGKPIAKPVNETGISVR